MSAVASIVADMTPGLDAGGSLLVLSDYDGTLTPIVSDPTEARLPPGVHKILRALAASPRMRVGILSGRTLADLRARVGIPELIYAGCHGLEVEGPGLDFRHPGAEAQRPILRSVCETLRTSCASIPGVWVESKGLAAALHYRNAAPRSVARLVTEVEWATQGKQDRLTLMPGKKVIDILPQARWNRGQCALWLLDQLASSLTRPVLPLYMGDDETDEIAFRALSGKAVTVAVGAGRAVSAAAYRLRNVISVHRLLAALAAVVGQRSGAR